MLHTPLREREYLFTRNKHTFRGVVDEHTEDGCQFVSTAELHNHVLTVHVHAENGHLFHSIHPWVLVDVILKNGQRKTIVIDVGGIPGKIHREFYKRMWNKNGSARNVKIPVKIDNIDIQEFKMYHIYNSGCVSESVEFMK